MFSMTAFSSGGGCLKAPRSEEMDGWVRGGGSPLGGRLFQAKIFDVDRGGEGAGV